MLGRWGVLGGLSPTVGSPAWAGAGSRDRLGLASPTLPRHPQPCQPPSTLPCRLGKPGRVGALDPIQGCNNLAGLSLQVDQPLGRTGAWPRSGCHQPWGEGARLPRVAVLAGAGWGPLSLPQQPAGSQGTHAE